MYVGQEFTGKLENCGYTVEGMVVDGGYGKLENCTVDAVGGTVDTV